MEVFCESCGTELEIRDITTDLLLKVILKARPCPKCSRPPDCQLSCEDILELKKDLKNIIEKKVPLCFGTNKNDVECANCKHLYRCIKLTEEL